MADLPEIKFKGNYGAFFDHILNEILPGIESPDDWVKILWRFGNLAWRSGYEFKSEEEGKEMKFTYGPFCGKLVMATKYFDCPLIYIGSFKYRDETYAAVCLVQLMSREIENLDESSCVLEDLRAGRMSSMKSFSDRVFIIPLKEIVDFWGSMDNVVGLDSGV